MKQTLTLLTTILLFTLTQAQDIPKGVIPKDGQCWRFIPDKLIELEKEVVIREAYKKQVVSIPGYIKEEYIPEEKMIVKYHELKEGGWEIYRCN